MAASVAQANHLTVLQGGQIGAPPKTERLLSLDVFRGLTIAGMILVNNPGSWSYVYAPLAHAEWNGWTPTDLIFPFFLFIVGVAITYSIGGKVERGESQKRLIFAIARRSAILFALGLFLNGFPLFPLDKIVGIRIPGVLQRIAVCFFFASLIFIKTKIRGQVIWAITLLGVYWLLMKMVPVPEYGAGVLTPEGSLEGFLDRLLLGNHIYKPTHDPEGILSTLPAIATTLCGILTGHYLQAPRQAQERTNGLLLSGMACLAAGKFMDLWFPINKNLWSSSYVVFTTGAALLCLGVCYWLIDVQGYKRWAKPFVVFGSNAITVFVASGVVGRLLFLIKWNGADGNPVTLKGYIYDHFFASWAGALNGSLAFAIFYILFWLAPMWWLYRRKIFIKV
jgi:predicted acyltransferase